jgi:hypothetical protein
MFSNSLKIFKIDENMSGCIKYDFDRSGFVSIIV